MQIIGEKTYNYDTSKIDKKENATGIHFSSHGHSKKDATVQVIERFLPNSSFVVTQRETHWIRKLITQIP